MSNAKRPLRPLSEEDIRNIRKLKGKLTGSELSRIYDRSQGQISAIQNKLSYRWVADEGEPIFAPAATNKKFDVANWFNRHNLKRTTGDT